jgi:hypothetical protein
MHCTILLADQPSGVLREVAQHLKCLVPQLDILVVDAQTCARQIERKSVE